MSPVCPPLKYMIVISILKMGDMGDMFSEKHLGSRVCRRKVVIMSPMSPVYNFQLHVGILVSGGLYDGK
jgi:hypothetical protein